MYANKRLCFDKLWQFLRTASLQSQLRNKASVHSENASSSRADLGQDEMVISRNAIAH